MIKPAKHGRDHLPGGEDPVAFETGGAVSAIADAGSMVARTVPGALNPFTMSSLYCTDGNSSLFYDVNGTPSSFQYIMLLQDGFYKADFEVHWSGTPFTTTDFPFIRPACIIDGTPDTLVNSLNLPYWQDTSGWIAGEVANSAAATNELTHHQFVATVWFNYEAALIDPSFGIGVALDSSKGSGTVTSSAAVAVTRLGAALQHMT